MFEVDENFSTIWDIKKNKKIKRVIRHSQYTLVKLIKHFMHFWNNKCVPVKAIFLGLGLQAMKLNAAFVSKYQSGIEEATYKHIEWWIVQNPWKWQNIAWSFYSESTNGRGNDQDERYL